SLFIDLLKTQGDVQVLSSPRVSTVNNQKAVIKVGFDEFFVTGIETDVSGTTGNTNVSAELTPFFSGVALDVTPQISEDGQIVLHVHPSVSEVNEQVKNITTTVGNLSLPLAASTIRESDSIIRAANGQVVVIGGLMQNSTRDEQSSVPILGSIPVLGALFRHKKKIKYKSELVILLKPVIVDESGQQWSDELKRSSSVFKNMQ
ncbi:MAG: pilus (MSHA type) biogenesis protein MshL, partial [Gammaproteobacteria bacterium]|nr:pilus (MSHA type) biogenesis protein MshL [Gammaproteobacteria bacterium]